MLSEREKLEEELRFLKESLEIGVITKEEFENGRERIEKRTEQIDRIERRNKGLDIEVKEVDEEVPDVKIEEKKESQLTLEGKKTKGKKEDGEIETEDLDEETDLLEPRENLEIKEDKEQEKLVDGKEKDTEGIDDVDSLLTVEPKEQDEKKEDNESRDIAEEAEIKINKKLLAFSLLIMVAALGIWYLFYSGNNNPLENDDAVSLIACYSDKDCKLEGKIGMCSGAGQENSECSYTDDVRIKLRILNSDECFNCDTARVLSIIKSFYPNLEIENIDFGTEGGNQIAGEFDLKALPAYILNSSVLEAYNHEKFSGAFNKINNNFVMKSAVANSNYYIDRNEIPQKLDLFMQENHEASIQSERNLQEFLQAFNGKVIFEKHGPDSALAKELGINSFPAFLVNNKDKFSGVQPADMIKESFCKMNDLGECSLVLSKNLI